MTLVLDMYLCFYVAMLHATGNSQDQWMSALLQRPLTCKDIFALGGDHNIWYPLGLWLGLEERRLQDMKACTQQLRKVEMVLTRFENNLAESEFQQADKAQKWINLAKNKWNKIVDGFFRKGYAYLMDNSEKLLSLLQKQDEQAGSRLLHLLQLDREKKLISALLNLGYKDSIETVKGL